MDGWQFIDDQASVPCVDAALCQMTSGPGEAPLGSGSAELSAPTSAAGVALALQAFGGTRLDNITDLRYATLRQSSDPGNNLAIALQLTADFDLTDNSTAWQGRLVFEPYQANGGQVSESLWQTWDAKAGKWWGTRATVTRNGVAVTNPCVQSSPCTWSELLAAFPNLGIHPTYGSLFLKAGSGWTGFKGNVDALTIGVGGVTTTYDFELVRPMRVPLVAPDSIPRDFFADSNLTTDAARWPAPLVKDAVMVIFTSTATQAERQAAIDAVQGFVVGGAILDTSYSIYLLKLPRDTTNDRVFSAVDALSTRPEVNLATIAGFFPSEPQGQRPNDGPGMQRSDWKLDISAAFPIAESPRLTWALEAIGAPMAWGCSTGGLTAVGTIDSGIQNAGDIVPNFAGDPSQFGRNPGSHGTQVASVLGARGNDGSGMTGVMWTPRLFLEDPTYTLRGVVHANELAFIRSLYHLLRNRVRVVNISLGAVQGAPPAPRSAGMDAIHASVAKYFTQAIAAYPESPRPLWVIASGNAGWTSDTYDSPYEGLLDALPTEAMMVTGASTLSGLLAQDATGTGRIAISAPGEDVAAMDGAGVRPFTGTSYAAPLVAGAAGLLFDFDPSLTAQQVRAYLIEGAMRGGRKAGEYPLLNAYESLKLAASRPGSPVCGNRLWVDDFGTPRVQRDSSIFEPLAATTGLPGDHLFAPHGGKRLIYSTANGPGIFEWSLSGHTWGPSNIDFWELPDSITTLVGRPRSDGWDHDGALVATVENNGTQVGVYVRDTTRISPHRWRVGQIPSRGTDAGVIYAIRQQLATKLVCIWYANDPCGDHELHAADLPYPDSLATFDTLPPTVDQSYGQAGFSMRGDSIFATLVPVVSVLSWTDWAPCPENTGFVDGYAFLQCRSPVYTYAFGGPAIWSLPASSEGSANPNAPAQLLAHSDTLFAGHTPLWITSNEAGDELIVADGVRHGTTLSDMTFADCRLRWIGRANALPSLTINSNHSCTDRGVGGAAPVSAGNGIKRKATNSAPKRWASGRARPSLPR